MPKHSDVSEDEEEWLEEELSRGKGKKKGFASSGSEDESEGVSLNDDFSDSDSGSDASVRRGGRTSGSGGRQSAGGAKAAPPPLKKRRSSSHRTSPSDSSDEARDDDDADSGDGYGDDLMGDDQDRAYLASLTEMERERILNERYEARKKRLERLDLRRKLQQSKGTRASSRASTAKATGGRAGVKASALSNLKAKREEKASRAKRRAKEIEDRLDVEAVSSDDSDHWSDRTTKRAKHDSRSSVAGDRSGWDADRSRDDGREEKEKRKDKVEVRSYPTLEDINSVKLHRSLLEKWVDQPFFEKVVPGFFVRVGIGMNREQQNAYRMARIVAAEKGPRTYTLGKKKTQYMLKLSHGSNNKNFSIEYISNSPITMPEYERWLREMDKADLEIPTPEDLHTKRKEIDNTRNYIYTNEDIERMIQEKSQLRARPVNLAATKAYLQQLREAAKDKGTPEEVAKIETELKRFEELDKRETEKRQKKLKVGDINKRNKAKNIVSSHVTAQIEAVMAETDNPFSRRPTAPTFHIFAKGAPPPASSSSSSAPTEAMALADTNVAAPAASPSIKGKEKEKEKASKHEDSIPEPTALLQVHDTLDLEIDVNLDDLASPTPVSKRPAGRVPQQRRSTGSGEQKTTTRAISLDDYKRRRGLI